MKQKYKLILIICFAACLNLFPQLLFAQETEPMEEYITISGVVKGARNIKALENVHLSLPNSHVGTVTNEDGEFVLKISKALNAKVLIVSHIGYLNSQIVLTAKDMLDLQIRIKPHSRMLEEMLIHGYSADELIKAAIEKIPINYTELPTMLSGFYRETAKKRNHYITISEAILNVYKTPYNRQVSQDKVQVLKGRKLLAQKSSDTLGVKMVGGPNQSVLLDFVKNYDLLIHDVRSNYYGFTMEDVITIDDRLQYVVHFFPKMIVDYALFSGRFYIDMENLSFTRAEFKLDMKDQKKAISAILKKKPFDLRFKPTEISFLINYKEQDGQTHLSYVRNEVHFRCDWKRRLFSTRYAIVSEMVVTDRTTSPETIISRKEAFKRSRSLSDELSKFSDPNFWGAFNIIEPTESLENAINKLRKL